MLYVSFSAISQIYTLQNDQSSRLLFNEGQTNIYASPYWWCRKEKNCKFNDECCRLMSKEISILACSHYKIFLQKNIWRHVVWRITKTTSERGVQSRKQHHIKKPVLKRSVDTTASQSSLHAQDKPRLHVTPEHSTDSLETCISLYNVYLYDVQTGQF